MWKDPLFLSVYVGFMSGLCLFLGLLGAGVSVGPSASLGVTLWFALLSICLSNNA